MFFQVSLALQTLLPQMEISVVPIHVAFPCPLWHSGPCILWYLCCPRVKSVILFPSGPAIYELLILDGVEGTIALEQILVPQYTYLLIVNPGN